MRIKPLMPLALVAPALALPLAAHAAPGGSSVTVEVLGIAEAKGMVRVAVCTPEHFAKAGCTWNGAARAQAGKTVVTVPGVPPGRYAAQAYWDENGNGKADRNFLGLPTELVGFSNDQRVKMSRPTFDKSAFAHDSGDTRIAITVRKIP